MAPPHSSAQRQTLAKRLRACRDRAGLTQAAAADEIGVDMRTFRRWEAGTGSPRGRLAADAVAKFLADHAPR